MKKILAVFCSMAIAVSAMAELTINATEDVFDAGNNTARFGARFAWDLTDPSNTMFQGVTNVLSSGSGFSIGGFYDIPLWKNLYFEPGVNLCYGTMGYSYIYETSPNIFSPGGGSVRNLYFGMPLLGAFRFDLNPTVKVSVFTGPKLNFGLSNELHVKEPAALASNRKEYSYSLYSEDSWHRMDVQWMLGVRLHYDDNWFAEISGGWGVTNLFNVDFYNKTGEKNPNIKRNQFSIGVGYLF